MKLYYIIMCVRFLRPLYAVSSWVITITPDSVQSFRCGFEPCRGVYMIAGKRWCQFLWFSINTFSAQQRPWASASWFTYTRSHSCGKVHLRKRSFSFSETFSECLACDSKILDYKASRVCVTIKEGSETQRLHRGCTAYVCCIEDPVWPQSAEMRLG